MRRVVALLLALGTLSIVAACGQAPTPTPLPTATPVQQAPTPTPVAMKLLRATPETGPVGTPFTVSGEGFTPGKEVEFVWATSKGNYDARVENNKAVFYNRRFEKVRRSSGRATADASGKVSVSLVAPEDFGWTHEIYAVVDGTDVAKGGFRVDRTMTVSPSEGPVGTLITVRVTGLGAGLWDSTAALLYDNSYAGFVSATTTNGTAVFKVRAAGPAGKHSLRLGTASHTVPYFNQEQSPPFWAPPLRAAFIVTPGASVPPASLEWPDPAKVAPLSASIPRTTVLGRGEGSGVSASLSSSRGPILSRTDLKATGLPKGATVNVLWATAAGNDVTGWNVSQDPLTQVVVDGNGGLATSLQVPDTLGGWHAVLLVNDEKVVSEIPYYVERSFVAVAPPRVKAGEVFKVEVKGVGWTEIDNGVAITYDNSYIGYACGFCCNGDVTLYVEATGGPGVHLIDLYPMIYDGGHGEWPWQYNTPQLTALEDHPGLGLGYNLPIFRLAVEVVE